MYKNCNFRAQCNGKCGSTSMAITHHLDVGVLSKQAVIGHWLKEKTYVRSSILCHSVC